MNTIELKNLTVRLRNRLLEYRNYKKDKVTSIHINSLDIALCLAECSLSGTPSRAITLDEEQWFNGGYYLDMVLQNSEWSDLAGMYYMLGAKVREANFFRNGDMS